MTRTLLKNKPQQILSSLDLSVKDLMSKPVLKAQI